MGELKVNFDKNIKIKSVIKLDKLYAKRRKSILYFVCIKTFENKFFNSYKQCRILQGRGMAMVTPSFSVINFLS